MSAAQMKRIGALEQTLSEWYASEWAALEKLLDAMIGTIFEGLSDEEVRAMQDLKTDPLSPFVMWVRSLGATTYEDSYLSEVNGWTGQIILALAKESPPPLTQCRPSQPMTPGPAWKVSPCSSKTQTVALTQRGPAFMCVRCGLIWLFSRL